ncbi:MAG: transposase [Planctomycetes bacterium]|nr:transposase [Planctomycetota bacterium]
MARIIELATQYGRYGYRRITAMLRREGWRVNHKRVERLWRREGPKMPKRQPPDGGVYGRVTVRACGIVQYGETMYGAMILYQPGPMTAFLCVC